MVSINKSPLASEIKTRSAKKFEKSLEKQNETTPQRSTSVLFESEIKTRSATKMSLEKKNETPPPKSISSPKKLNFESMSNLLTQDLSSDSSVSPLNDRKTSNKKVVLSSSESESNSQNNLQQSPIISLKNQSQSIYLNLSESMNSKDKSKNNETVQASCNIHKDDSNLEASPKNVTISEHFHANFGATQSMESVYIEHTESDKLTTSKQNLSNSENKKNDSDSQETYESCCEEVSSPQVNSMQTTSDLYLFFDKKIGENDINDEETVKSCHNLVFSWLDSFDY